MPVSIASSVFSMGPILTTVFASLFLKEIVTIYDYISLMFAFFGVVVVNNPFKIEDSHGELSTHNLFLGTVYALTGALAFSAAVLCMRLMSTGIHFSVSPFWYATGCTYLGSLMHFGFLNQSYSSDEQKSTVYDFYQIVLILLVSLTAFFGQNFASKAYQLEKASILAPMNYLHTISCFFWDTLFFKAQLQPNHIIGSILIFSGVFTVSILRALGFKI